MNHMINALLCWQSSKVYIVKKETAHIHNSFGEEISANVASVTEDIVRERTSQKLRVFLS